MRIIKGFIWKAVQQYSTYFIKLIFQIVLARILSASEFGLVAEMLVYIAVAEAFANGGFGTALTQKKNADSDEIILNSTKDKADFTTRSLTKKDDESVYDLVIRNDNDFPVTVTPKLVSNNNNEYFEISSDWMDAQGNSQPKEIPANSTLPYKLTIKLIKMPTSVQTTSVSIELTVTGEQPQNP